MRHFFSGAHGCLRHCRLDPVNRGVSGCVDAIVSHVGCDCPAIADRFCFMALGSGPSVFRRSDAGDIGHLAGSIGLRRACHCLCTFGPETAQEIAAF